MRAVSLEILGGINYVTWIYRLLLEPLPALRVLWCALFGLESQYVRRPKY